MSTLDPDIREDLKVAIAQLFETPEQWEAQAKMQLKCLELEPTLDSALALFWGTTYGQIRNKIWERHGAITLEQIKEIVEIAMPRWPELKEFYLSRRLFKI